MATDKPESAAKAQRTYSAPCPGCGAPVEFRSAQSTHAVCGFCKSTVVRTGDVLSRIGKMAELFDDFSPLQLMASGTYEQRAFTLVGRLQYKYEGGTWTEWVAVFDADGSSGYLSEDNGAFVFSLPANSQAGLPEASRFVLGATTAIGGKTFTVASNQDVALLSAQGELTRLPGLGTPFYVVELRSADGQVLSIDYGPTLIEGGVPALSTGRAVNLDDLKLSGLKQASAQESKGQQFACPNCGASVSLALGTSKSITCSSCNSIIDVSQGVAGQLAHAEQDQPVKLLIALGTTGVLQGASWQVVGFQHRTGFEASEPDEHFGWSEYLLFNAKRGFVFLVDATDGWSLVKPTTGAATFKPGASSASYLGSSYQLLSAYQAETTYVAGEFYWQVKRGEITQNHDFTKGKSVLSRELAAKEVTWSLGEKIDAQLVAAAFKLNDKKELFKRADAQPFSAAPQFSIVTIIVILVVILIVLSLLGRCSSCDPARENCSSRTSGGSFGGFSGGGGHK